MANINIEALLSLLGSAPINFIDNTPGATSFLLNASLGGLNIPGGISFPFLAPVEATSGGGDGLLTHSIVPTLPTSQPQSAKEKRNAAVPSTMQPQQQEEKRKDDWDENKMGDEVTQAIWADYKRQLSEK